MRKIIATISAALAAAVLTVSSAFGATVTKNYDFKSFSSIDVSNTFDVTLSRSSRCTVKVTVSDEYEDYLDIRVTKDKLYIGFKNLPTRLSAVQGGRIAKAEISMPSLESLSLSGASELTSEDNFDLGRGSFTLSVSGASKLQNLDVNAGEARMYVSGASKASLAGEFVELHLTVAGASRAELVASADELDAKASGTGVIELNGLFDEVGLHASGVGNITMAGEAEEIDAKGSGTAGFNLEKIEAMHVEVELSGASVAKVNALKTLSVGLGGSSRCNYVDNPGLRIEKRISGASKLKAL